MSEHRNRIVVPPLWPGKGISGFLFFALIVLLAVSLFSVTADLYSDPGKNNLSDPINTSRTIDQHISDQWRKKDLVPSPLASDDEFLRRVTLDIAGKIPTPLEVKEFLDNPDKNKRMKKIDELLQSGDYGENMSHIWMRQLVGRTFRNQSVRPVEFKKWLEDSFNQNIPFNDFVTALLTVEGSNIDNPGAGYLVKFEGEAADIAGNVSKLFMAKQIQCAQCHNHPYESFSQEDFWGMAAFFAQTNVRPIRQENRVIGAELYDRPRGEVYVPNRDPRTPIEPRFITGEKIGTGFMTRRRSEFVRLLVSPDNPYFAKAIVNRIWDYLTGRGIIDPIDDFSDLNKPSHPELLDYLTRDFVEHGYDLKYLIRSITYSRTYQLTSRANETNRVDVKYYTHAVLRPMSAEQLFHSLLRTTGMDNSQNALGAGRMEQMREAYLRRFVTIFDNDEMEEGENFQGTIPQALMMLNSELVNQGIRARPGMTLGHIMQNIPTEPERVDWLYLATLSRYPSADERRKCLDYIFTYGRTRADTGEVTYVQVQSDSSPRDRFESFRQQREQYQRNRSGGFGGNPAYEDIFWVLLNSAEFILNH